MRYPESNSTQKTAAGLRQPMISSFFSQPSKGAGAASQPLSDSSSPIDLTISDDDEQPAKKRKTAHGPTSDSNTQRRHQSPHSPASRWRYVPSQSPEKTPVDAEVKRRRELFSKQLLEDNSSFVDTAGPSDGHGLPSDQADGGPNSSDVQSDGEFKHLQQLFARKTEQKKKRTVVERASKKQPELGPSGEPYTALELQVCFFRADWRTGVHNEIGPSTQSET
jgi:hypothetical protein